MDERTLHSGDGGSETQGEIPSITGSGEGSTSGRSEERVCEDEHAGSSHVPLTPGKTYYLKRISAFVAHKLISLNRYESLGAVVGTALVRTPGGLETICKQSELLTEEQYRAELARRRKEFYDKCKPIRMAEAREKYKKLIDLWERGHQTPQDLLKCTGTGTARYWGGQIAAAKRWELIK